MPSGSLTAAFQVLFIGFIFLVNLLGVRVFGELEFWFSSIKGTFFATFGAVLLH